MSKQLPTRTYCKRNRPLPYYHPNCRTPRHWKFTQDHRTTRPPPLAADKDEQSLWFIEKIIRKRKQNGKLQYLVKGEGFPKQFNSWVDSESIKDKSESDL